jgi:hypothetical protein
MSANDGRVNEQMLQIGVTSKGLMKLLEDALPAPTREPLIDGVLIAVLRRQESPLCAAPSDPQHGFEKLAAILLLPDISVRVGA